MTYPNQLLQRFSLLKFDISESFFVLISDRENCFLPRQFRIYLGIFVDAVLWNVTEKSFSNAENITENDEKAAHEKAVVKPHKMEIIALQKVLLFFFFSFFFFLSKPP